MNTTIDQRRDDRDDREWRDWALSQLEAAMAQAGKGNLLHVLAWPDPRLELDLVLMDPTGGPTGSLKDWYVRDLYYDAILRGRLRRGMLGIDATSGSMGIAEAYWAQRLGLRFIAAMPAHTTPAKQELIRQQGGECHLVSGPGTITEEAERLALRRRGHYIGQSTNAAPTPDWHGPNSLAVIAERQMRRPSLIEGDARQQIEPGFDFGLIDDVVGVTDEESLAMLSFLEELTGNRFGGTTGRVVHGALAKLLEMRNRGEQGSVLAGGGDDGGRYLDTLYSADWVAQQGFDTYDAGRRLHHLIAYFNAGDLTGR